MQRRTLTIVLLLVPFVGIGLLLSIKRAQGDGFGGSAAESVYKGEWWGAEESSIGSSASCPSVGEAVAYGGGGTTMENAFVHIGKEGRWSGKETKFLRGIPGYTMFENLYTSQGRFIAITSNASQLPPLTEFLSDMDRGTPQEMFPVADETRFLVITPEQAVQRFGSHRAARLVGPTFFMNDGPGAEGYLAHYFHFAAELYAGAWRVLSGAPSLIEKGTAMGMEFPRRTILAKGQDWRDEPGLNAWFMATMFPMMAVEDSMQWNDRSKSENLYIFDEIVIIDRWASHRHNPTAQSWNKMNGDVFRTVPAPPDWWAPVRESMMMTIGIENVHQKPKATVLYVSRQGASKRRLTEEAHQALIAALSSLDTIDFHVEAMEKLSKKDQMALISKTDVLIGVHGNGLTNEIWMKPGGAVMEIFDVGGFTRDYQLLTEPLRHTYIPIWNDTVYDWAADVPGFKLSDNFMGTDLVVSPTLIRDLVADLVKDGGKVDRNRKWLGGDSVDALD
ncbi:hypothetical protein BDY24DRAFT_49095 [Mrakia frigida]|uniref:uncharacterized protein n=1 Tax=Mrakia frigida TaxID=29902 RepID=UPI003FCBF8D6